MKKIITLLFISGIYLINLHAQINIELSLVTNKKSFQLENGEIILVEINRKQDQILIYNLDNSIRKSIPIKLPDTHFDKHFYFKIEDISTTTFNNDKELEIMYLCYQVNEEVSASGDGVDYKEFYDLIITTEIGNELLRIENVKEYKFLSENQNKKKLIVVHRNEINKSVLQIFSLK